MISMICPDGLKPGTLLRVKEHCRGNASILENGEYAILAPKQYKGGKSLMWDALFPNGQRVIFMPKNWEVINVPE
jgi:hypothetical protein